MFHVLWQIVPDPLTNANNEKYSKWHYMVYTEAWSRQRPVGVRNHIYPSLDRKGVALWKLGCSVLHGSSYTALHPWNRAILEDSMERTDGDKKHLSISLSENPANDSYWGDVS